MSKNCAIVVAAGKGKRMGTKISKQFLSLKDKPILFYTLYAFEKCKSVDSIVLVCAEDQMDYCKEYIIDKYNLKKVKKIVAGGKERQDSVFNGLKAAEGSDIVLIHDGARPFVEDKLIEDGIRYASMYGACTCGVTPKDTIKIKDEDGFSSQTPNRSTLFCVQTPQCFKYNMILECHENLKKEGALVTDDTMVVERYGNKVYLYEGNYNNIKITTPEDLIIGEKILEYLELSY